MALDQFYLKANMKQWFDLSKNDYYCRMDNGLRLQIVHLTFPFNRFQIGKLQSNTFELIAIRMKELLF